tara:strand:+ start:362 stop:922 length:561 start_codon:yes stop_codon:yes gene_type:complete
LRSVKLNITNSVGHNQDVAETKYCISLSRDTIFYFASLRDANKKRVHIEEYYTNHLYLINDLVVNTYSNYRHYIFLLKPFEIRFIKELFKEIDNCFDKVLKSVSTENSNYFKFNAIQSIYDCLSQVNGFLSTKALTKKDNAMKLKTKANEFNLMSLKELAQNYNQKLQKIYTHESALKIVHSKRHA